MRILPSILSLCIATQLPAQERGTGRIEGSVVDVTTGEPLLADVRIGARVLVRSDSIGRFSYESAPAGAVRLRAHALGYADSDTTITLAPGTTVRLSIVLFPSAHTLSAIRTTAPSADRQRFESSPTVSTVTVSGAETARVPSLGEADVLRAAATLPGVTSRNDYSAGFHVRGGEGDQNLVLLDGVPILNPWHMGGLYGTFIDEAVGSLEVMAGAFPAQYGGRLSSVLTVTSTEDRRPGVHSTAEVSLLSSSVAMSGAIRDGAVSWSVAGRRTYADAVIDAVQDEFKFPYHFQDAQTHWVWRMPRGARLSFTGYAGKDLMYVSEEDNRDGSLTFDWGNQAAGLSFTIPLFGSLVAEQTAGYSRFFTRLDVTGDQFYLAHSMDELRLAGHVTGNAGAHQLKAGYELTRHAGSYRELINIPTNTDVFADPYATDGDTTMRQRGSSVAGFLEDTWRFGRFLLRPGVRAEYVPRANWLGVSPRLGLRYFATESLALSLAAGWHSQWMHAVRNEDLPIRIFDLWVLSEPGVPVSRASHVIAGAEKWLSPTRFLRLEGWNKWYRDLPEPGSTVDPRIRPSLLRIYDGRAYGADLYLRQMQAGRWSGWLSYGYAVTERERSDVRYFPAHDRRHNANLVLGYSAGRWNLGARAAVATGTPFTGWAGTMSRLTYDQLSGGWLVRYDVSSEQVRGERNGERYPLYHRVDLLAERQMGGERVRWRPYLSVVNLMRAKNVFAYEFRNDTTPATMRGIPQLPFIPTFGVRVEF